MPTTKLLLEVEEHLKQNREPYLNFLRDLEGGLRKLRTRPEWSSVVYRIYSRAEKQLGNPFKAEQKIAEKLERWRKKIPKTTVAEIHDIIALTIVVTYPSDLPLLAGYLAKNTDSDLSDFHFRRPDDKRFKEENLDELSKGNSRSERDRGYYACHIKVESAKPIYADILCEVQIKTMLHDGWSAKTHDLTYKPGGELDERLGKHIGVLGDVLQLLDDQSELVKELITEKWNMDKSRKAVVRLQLLTTLAEDDAKLPYYGKITELVNKLKTETEYFRYARDADAEYRNFVKAVRDLLAQHGHSRTICRLITLLASVRDTGDLNRYALNEINKWKNHTRTTPQEHTKALLFYALANYVFGQFAEAVKAGEQALRYCAKNNTERLPGVKQTLSYLIAEEYYHHKKTLGTKYAARAKKLIGEVLESCKGQECDPQYLDTKGFIGIACGETESEVKSGLDDCFRALTKINKTDKARRSVAEAFYRLHERRAHRRLLEWE